MSLNDPVLDAREGPSRGLMSAKDVVPVVFDAEIAEARAILSASAGTVDIVTAEGATRTGVPIQAGITPIRIAQVNTGGSVVEADLWLVY